MCTGTSNSNLEGLFLKMCIGTSNDNLEGLF